jgi:hypothetical protein
VTRSLTCSEGAQSGHPATEPTTPGPPAPAPGPHGSGGTGAGKQVLEARELPPSRKGLSRSGRSHARRVTRDAPANPPPTQSLPCGVGEVAAPESAVRASTAGRSGSSNAPSPRGATPTRSKGSKLELHFRAPKPEARCCGADA